MIVILSAMAGEIEATRNALKDTQEAGFAGRKLLKGSLCGKEAVVGHTGIGKVLAAMTAQGVIERYRPEAIVFLGIAGAINPSYQIGDVVVARDCVQHDIDATRFGFPRGAIPHEDVLDIASDPGLVNYALRWKVEGRGFHTGRILSGDRFVTSAGDPEDAHLRGELNGDVVDMESAAVALVAHLNGVPFVVARVISDMADGTMPDGFKGFLRDASEIILDLARHFAAFRSGNDA